MGRKALELTRPGSDAGGTMPVMPLFLYGPLCHPPLLAAVAGAVLPAEPAVLRGHRLDRFGDTGAAVPVAEPGAAVEGLLLRPVGAEPAARIEAYATGLGARAAEAEVLTATGPATARLYLPSGGEPTDGPWSPADWTARWAEVAVAAAEELMAVRGSRPDAAAFARYPQVLVRAASRVRAGRSPAPTDVRRRAAPGDVAVLGWRQPYAAYFAIEEGDLSYRRFDGTQSAPVTRAVFISGDAATVLPYDPVRDRVMVIEQFRAGPWGRGDPQPWQIEAIAGRIDPGETPEDAARREAVEEAGLTLGALIPVAGYYPSPGAKSEYIHCFLGLADLPDALAGGVGGVADEHEDIRAHLLPFDRLMALVASGEVDNGQLLISALFLAARREALRRSA
jgi:nudix-type nucleoside diphosphatase (YffH/AdpP family)